MDSMKEALMSRKMKGMSVTLNIGDDGSVQVDKVEKLASEPPAPVGMDDDSEESGESQADPKEGGEDMESVFDPMSDRDLEMLKGKSKLSLGERAQLEAAMHSKRKGMMKDV